MRVPASLIAAVLLLSACLPNAAGPMGAVKEEESGPPAAVDHSSEAPASPLPPATTPPPPPEGTSEYFIVKKSGPLAAAPEGGIGPKPDNTNLGVAELAWRTWYGENLSQVMLQGDDTGESALAVQSSGPTPLVFRIQRKPPECAVKLEGFSFVPVGFDGSVEKWQSECLDKWVDASPGLKVRFLYEAAPSVQKYGEPFTRYCDTVVKMPLGRGPAANVAVPNLPLKIGNLFLYVYDDPATFADCKNGWAPGNDQILPAQNESDTILLGVFALKIPFLLPQGGPITFE
ncbi:MAG TPA: hypothetical protein VFX30_11570 [bacterium]|nr:hypothetical protein [bacterium]